MKHILIFIIIGIIVIQQCHVFALAPRSSLSKIYDSALIRGDWSLEHIRIAISNNSNELLIGEKEGREHTGARLQADGFDIIFNQSITQIKQVLGYKMKFSRDKLVQEFLLQVRTHFCNQDLKTTEEIDDFFDEISVFKKRIEEFLGNLQMLSNGKVPILCSTCSDLTIFLNGDEDACSEKNYNFIDYKNRERYLAAVYFDDCIYIGAGVLKALMREENDVRRDRLLAKMFIDALFRQSFSPAQSNNFVKVFDKENEMWTLVQKTYESDFSKEPFMIGDRQFLLQSMKVRTKRLEFIEQMVKLFPELRNVEPLSNIVEEENIEVEKPYGVGQAREPDLIVSMGNLPYRSIVFNSKLFKHLTAVWIQRKREERYKISGKEFRGKQRSESDVLREHGKRKKEFIDLLDDISICFDGKELNEMEEDEIKVLFESKNISYATAVEVLEILTNSIAYFLGLTDSYMGINEHWLRIENKNYLWERDVIKADVEHYLNILCGLQLEYTLNIAELVRQIEQNFKKFFTIERGTNFHERKFLDRIGDVVRAILNVAGEFRDHEKSCGTLDCPESYTRLFCMKDKADEEKLNYMKLLFLDSAILVQRGDKIVPILEYAYIYGKFHKEKIVHVLLRINTDLSKEVLRKLLVYDESDDVIGYICSFKEDHDNIRPFLPQIVDYLKERRPGAVCAMLIIAELQATEYVRELLPLLDDPELKIRARETIVKLVGRDAPDEFCAIEESV